MKSPLSEWVRFRGLVRGRGSKPVEQYGTRQSGLAASAIAYYVAGTAAAAYSRAAESDIIHFALETGIANPGTFRHLPVASFMDNGARQPVLIGGWLAKAHEIIAALVMENASVSDDLAARINEYASQYGIPTKPAQSGGKSGQDHESYSDTQDHESYTVDEEEE